jgi:hypothetical protein
VQVYALEVVELCKNFPEKGERRLEWVTFTEAAVRVAEPGLSSLILQFGQDRLAHHPDLSKNAQA